jgi:hypothetical protein
MPRTKKALQPLTNAEIQSLLERIAVTIAARVQNELGASATKAKKPVAARKATAAPSGTRRKGRGRRAQSKIAESAVLAVVKRAPKQGLSVSEIAKGLKADVTRVRPILWTMRDAKHLKTTGKLSTTRYHVA